MRRSVSLLPVFILACLAGCAEEKALPAKPADIEAKNTTNPLDPTKPERDDPAARAIVAQAIEAHTGGKPERLKNIVGHHVVFAGRGLMMEANSPEVEGSRETWSAWPNRYAFRFGYKPPSAELELPVQGATTPAGGYLKNLAGGVTALPAANLRGFNIDLFALDWTITPKLLAHPDAMFHTPASAESDGRRFQTVKAYIPGYPEFTLRFDEKTHLLDRVDYYGYETTTIPKSLQFSDHVEKNGLKVPGHVQVFNNTLRMWDLKDLKTYEVFESADKIDAKKFEIP